MNPPIDHSRSPCPTLQGAIDKLLSLHDGDAGGLAVVACGASAIPELRRHLYQREPSGLYEPRCHVVELLVRLG